MKVVDTRTTDVPALLRSRGVVRDAETERIVAEILEDVRARGDAALLEQARRFDAPDLDSVHLMREELDAWPGILPEATLRDLTRAYERVLHFHLGQRNALLSQAEATDSDVSAARSYRWSRPVRFGEVNTGTTGQRYVALSSVGVYVPGGRAAYPSSVYMNCAPAISAGVPRVIVATPAQTDGSLHPAVLVAIGLSHIGVVAPANVGMTLHIRPEQVLAYWRDVASISDQGVKAIKVGGAAAIAAMAFGTETVSRVDKVVGPGNRFVNEAKRQVWGRVGVDGYAGPSDVCVLVDEEADASFAAADLLTQIEHAPDNAAFLVACTRAKLREVLNEIDTQLDSAPRADTLRAALGGESLAIEVRDLAEAADVVNEIAPEHLTVMVRDPEEWLPRVGNAGCILLGRYSAESAADYCIGPSHTLPTAGAARWQGPLNVLDFLKVQSVSHLTAEDLAELGPLVETVGGLEGFPAHVRGATIRRSE